MSIIKLIKDYFPIVVDGFLPRMRFLLRQSDFSLGERIQLIMPGKNIKEKIIKRRIHKDKFQKNFVDLGRYKIYFDVDFNINNKDLFLSGITQVIWETFVIPELIYKFVKPKVGDVVFDIGANIGSTTILFSEMVGNVGKVYSFEPVTFKTIEVNMKSNNITNVTVIPFGVSFESGEAEIKISDFCLDSTIVKNIHAESCHNSRKIKLITIDEYCEKNNINKVNFIKMDIEGAEEYAIQGAKKLIEKCHPMWSISSYHMDSKNEPQHKKLVEVLKQLGYKIIELRNSHIWAI